MFFNSLALRTFLFYRYFRMGSNKNSDGPCMGLEFLVFGEVLSDIDFISIQLMNLVTGILLAGFSNNIRLL